MFVMHHHNRTRTVLGQTLFLAILLGLIYLQIDNDPTGARDRTGALFFILINQAMGAMMGVVTVCKYSSSSSSSSSSPSSSSSSSSSSKPSLRHLIDLFLSMYISIYLVPNEKAIFLREHNNHMYRTSAFYFSKVISGTRISYINQSINLFYPTRISHSSAYLILIYLLSSFRIILSSPPSSRIPLPNFLCQSLLCHRILDDGFPAIL